MQIEATRIAQLCYILGRLRIPPRSIKYVKTDALILSVPAKKVAAVKAISDLRFDQLYTLRRTYELPSAPTQPFINSAREMSPIASEDLVFRFSEKGLPLQGTYTPPHMDAPPPTPVPCWRDCSEEEAEQIVMSGGSLLVQGAPGSGKSFWVRERVKALKKKGLRIAVIAKTHCACQNFGMDAQTADAWVRKEVRNGGSVRFDLVVVEELSQVEVQLFADLCKYSLASGVAFILCGDFNKISAIAGFWGSCCVPYGALEQSDMVRDLAGRNRFTLTENKRGDQILYDF